VIGKYGFDRTAWNPAVPSLMTVPMDGDRSGMPVSVAVAYPAGCDAAVVPGTMFVKIKPDGVSGVMIMSWVL